MKFAAPFVIFLCVNALAAAPAKNSPVPVVPLKPLTKKAAREATEKLIQQAKTAMMQGQRRSAIALLDQARSMGQARPQIREIEAKRALFSEQFFSSESFQKFQAAKDIASVDRFEDCLREIGQAGESDLDNILILRLRAECQYGAKQYDEASRTFKNILGLMPGDVSATFGLVDIAVVQKQAAQGLVVLSGLAPKESTDVERYAILKARLLIQDGKNDDAVTVLKEDQEKNLDHIGVLYELGSLYADIGGHDWAARRLLSFFVTRCKRLKDAELRARGLEKLVPLAQTRLVEVDKRLGVQQQSQQ